MINVIEATIWKEKLMREDVPLPRVPMIPTGMQLELKRLWFVMRFVIAIAINEIQR